MEFNFSAQNIVDGQAVPISITGMIIVFCVLTLLSLFIAALPRILQLVSRIFPEKVAHTAKVSQPSANESRDEEAIAAIALVLHRRKGR